VEIARLALATVEGIGIRRIRALERWRAPDEIAQVENVTELVYGGGVSLSLATRVMARFAERKKIEQQWNALSRNGVRAIFFDDADYPARLKRIKDAPPVLFVKGDAAILERRGIGVVGTRSPSPEGSETAAWIGEMAASLGWNVVSGLAYGIDAAAHRGALSVAEGGTTVAVLGCGLLSVYPEAHVPLAAEIAERGALVSEQMWGEVRAAWLVRRNRLISGLSDGVLLVECAERDGAMHTARFANEQGRPLAVWKWEVLSSESSGTRRLSAHGVPSVERGSFARWLSGLSEASAFVTYPPTLFEGAEGDEREEVVSGSSTAEERVEFHSEWAGDSR